MVQSPGSNAQTSFLGGCLVEGDSEFEKRARKIKRRALVASIVVQVLILAALVLVPLLSKGEGIAAFNPTIIPPYRHAAVSGQHQREVRPADGRRAICITCIHDTRPILSDPGRIPSTQTIDDVDPAPPGSPEPAIIPSLSNNSMDRHLPTPPTEPARPRTLKVSAGVQAARLVRRVEPSYPPLAKQIRREGRVELHAIIGTDGRIKSLEVVSGEALFLQSSLSAVQEWRYQPTLLNGEPVEIDTYITVVYTLNR